MKIKCPHCGERILVEIEEDEPFSYAETYAKAQLFGPLIGIAIFVILIITGLI